MGNDVFISYSSRDNQVAQAVCAALESNGIRCWMAPRDISPGADWANCILDAINSCRLMLIIFSSGANESQHVRREVERAAHRGVIMLPLRIEAVGPVAAMEYFLSASHWMDALTPPIEKHLRKLSAHVRSLLEASGGSAAPLPDLLARTNGQSTSVPSAAPARRRGLVIGATIVLLLASGVWIWKVLGSGKAGVSAASATRAGAISSERLNPALPAAFGPTRFVPRQVTFAAPLRYPLSNAASSNFPRILLGDFNGDGKLDILVYLEDGVVLVPGKVGGGFDNGLVIGERLIYPKVAADFNHDGATDFVSFGHFGDAVFLSGNHGNRWTAVPLDVVSLQVAAAVGDFNHDGNTDFASVNPAGDLSVHLGDGTGRFKTSIVYDALDREHHGGAAATFQETTIFAGDFNGDGNLDLVLSTSQDFTTYACLLLGDGQGHFARPQTIFSDSGNPHPVIVAAADFNMDGVTDLLLASSGANGGVSVLFALVDPGHAPRFTRRKIGNLDAVSVVTGDFNGDGIPDIAISNPNAGQVCIFLSRGNGTFADPLIFSESIPVSANRIPWGLYAADLNRHGKSDLLLLNPDDNSLRVMINTTSTK